MPAQYVKPFVKTNKSDYIDAEAIAEAVTRPRMRFVPIKTDEQLDLQSLHRVRERWVMRRTAIVNQICGLLLERGITLAKGRSHLNAALPGILENADLKLSSALRTLLAQLKLELDQMALRINEADAVLNKTAHENADCQRLVAIPGLGPVTATALVAAIGNGAAFHNGRGFAAWMGIVPEEYSTGGKQKLLGISKRGNSYLRRLFIQGARAVLQQSTKQTSGLSTWLEQLLPAPTATSPPWPWPTNWPAWPGLCSQRMNPIGLRRISARPQLDWPADDAWLTPSLEIASAIPTSAAQRRLRNLSVSCQVCWRTMR
jgi:transposase